MPSIRPHKKSRLGCVQCKQRRIKCHGGPPQCRNCCARRLECEYTQWTFPSVLLQTSHRQHLASLPFQDSHAEIEYHSAHGITPYLDPLPPCIPPLSLSSVSEAWNPVDAAALHYFRTGAAADFHGYLASDFWTSMLYQKSEHCVPVRQALLAISNAHRERVTAFAEPLSETTLRLYGKAIELAVEHMQESTIFEVRATSLYCCAVFYCFELFNKNPRAADLHLDNGLRLLREWHRISPIWPPSSLQQATRDDFVQVLYTIGRLDLDRMLRNGAMESSEYDDDIFASGLGPLTDHPTDDFDLKCKTMLLSRRITRFTRAHGRPDTVPISELPLNVLISRLHLHCQITELETMLDQRETRIHASGSPNQPELTALSTLRLYLVTHRVRLTTMLALDEAQRTAVYDEYANIMLKYASKARDSFGPRGERAPLMPEPGVLVPIQWLARGVSREESRREARQFIDEYYAVEGVCVFE